MRYWWVNHSQTNRQEVEGGYLWSPLVEANGARSRFYENMRRAAPGDVVLSYASGRVGKVGVVSDYAIQGPKPQEFGTVGLNWNATGWLLPTQWLDTSIDIRPKDLLTELRPLLPATHSPIQAESGNGNQKAYLAEVDRAVVELMLNSSPLSLASLESMPIASGLNFVDELDDLVERQIAQDTSLEQTEREQLTRARRGQGIFRTRVLAIEPVCRISGVSTPNLLIASHIKPWRICDSAAERLDGLNGLMLAPHIDFLFDRGLLSFDDNGQPLYSSQLSEIDAQKFGLRADQRPAPKRLSEGSLSYFRHHRTNVYIA